jgi:integrase
VAGALGKCAEISFRSQRDAGVAALSVAIVAKPVRGKFQAAPRPLPRENDLVQLSIFGKGEKPRQVLLPDVVSRSLLTLRGDASANDPVFASRKGGHLTTRAVHGMVKRAAGEPASMRQSLRIG